MGLGPTWELGWGLPNSLDCREFNCFARKSTLDQRTLTSKPERRNETKYLDLGERSTEARARNYSKCKWTTGKKFLAEPKRTKVLSNQKLPAANYPGVRGIGTVPCEPLQMGHKLQISRGETHPQTRHGYDLFIGDCLVDILSVGMNVHQPLFRGFP